jgi:hypothetical protein
MSLLGSAGDTALRNLTQPKGAPVIGGLTWGELDRLVDEDPIALRDRAWTEIQELRGENQRLRAEITEYALRVTMGGPTVPVDTKWANVDLPAPESASDPSAPPLRTGRGSHRLAKPAG